MMKTTFKCDESTLITIPIGSLKDIKEGQLMPEKFHCVFKDNYKIFVNNGRPKPLGAAQAIAGVFVFCLGFLLLHTHGFTQVYTLPSVLFVVCGLLSYAAGQSPNMHVAKMSFSLNIISFFWSLVAVILCALTFPVWSPDGSNLKVHEGVKALIMVLLVVEKFIALFLIYWLSKAICREHFNTLPIIRLKQNT